MAARSPGSRLDGPRWRPGAGRSPEGLATRSHAEYDESDNLVDMIREDLVAERVAIQSYQEIARWLGDKDPTTRTLIERILAVEEEHADDLLGLLDEYGR